MSEADPGFRQILVILTGEPEVDSALVGTALSAADQANCRPVLVIPDDLTAHADRLTEVLRPLNEAGLRHRLAGVEKLDLIALYEVITRENPDCIVVSGRLFQLIESHDQAAAVVDTLQIPILVTPSPTPVT